MLKLVVTLAVITYASALFPPSLGSCSWGQSHWCSSLKIAKQCEAVNYCVATVWAHQTLLKDNNNTCQFCENIIKDVKNFIDNKQTQDQIMQYFNQACDVLPTPDMVKECKSVAKNYWAEFMQMVDADLNPQVICATIGMCGGLEDKVKHTPVKPQMPKLAGDICKDCEAFFTDVKNIISSKTTQEELKDLIEQLCSQMGAEANTCKQLVELYLPEIIQMLEAEVDPTVICKTMGFCNASKKLAMLLKKAQRPKGTADVCADCKTFFADVKAIISSEATEKEIEELLDTELCPQLGQMEDTCKMLVKSYLPEIIAMIKAEDDPAKICMAMGFCKNATMSKEKLMKTLITKTKTMHQTAPKKSLIKASTQCVLCEFVMKEIDSLLSENSTEVEIIAALDKVCSLLPSDISKECKQFVDTYGPTIILLLRSELTPSEVCQTLGLCNQHSVNLVKSGEACTVCKVAIQYLDSLISEKPTEKEIEQALDKVCNFLPQNMRSECQQIVEQYTPMLIQLLLQEGTPEQVCSAIKLCTSNQPKPLKVRRFAPEKIVAKKSQLLGSNKCTWGPSYWCASEENANKCNAMAHCKKHVWN